MRVVSSSLLGSENRSSILCVVLRCSMGEAEDCRWWMSGGDWGEWSVVLGARAAERQLREFGRLELKGLWLRCWSWAGLTRRGRGVSTAQESLEASQTTGFSAAVYRKKSEARRGMMDATVTTAEHSTGQSGDADGRDAATAAGAALFEMRVVTRVEGCRRIQGSLTVKFHAGTIPSQPA